MKRMLAVLVPTMCLATGATAATLAVTQPTGGSHVIGAPMTIAWTKDFTATGAAASAMTIRVRQLSGDMYVDRGLVAEVSVNASPFTWQSAGSLQSGSLPAGGNYHVFLQMKGTPSVVAMSAPFSLKPRLVTARRQALPSGAIRVYVPIATMECSLIFCWMMWDRSNIEGYESVHFWIRRPDGSIGSRDQVFGTAPNVRSETGGDCASGNCGKHALNLGADALLPSPGDKYYFELFTMDRKHTGKSATFTWK